MRHLAVVCKKFLYLLTEMCSTKISASACSVTADEKFYCRPGASLLCCVYVAMCVCVYKIPKSPVQFFLILFYFIFLLLFRSLVLMVYTYQFITKYFYLSYVVNVVSHLNKTTTTKKCERKICVERHSYDKCIFFSSVQFGLLDFYSNFILCYVAIYCFMNSKFLTVFNRICSYIFALVFVECD